MDDTHEQVSQRKQQMVPLAERRGPRLAPRRLLPDLLGLNTILGKVLEVLEVLLQELVHGGDVVLELGVHLLELLLDVAQPQLHA